MPEPHLDVPSALAQQREQVVEAIRDLAAAHPEADHLLFEYLFGLDHAVLGYARTAEHAELSTADPTVFPGFGDHLATLAAYDDEHGTRLAADFRADEDARDLVDDWFDSCWREAGGSDLPIASYLMYEGDSDWFDLRVGEWGRPGATIAPGGLTRGEVAGDRFLEVEVTSEREVHSWLEQHHDRAEGIWLVTYKQAVPAKYVTRDAVLDELIAFGWCDGRMMRIDDERVMQQISPRRTQPWAKSYKDRAERLIAEGRMHPSGQACVNDAKATGAWDAMNDVDDLLVPDDLASALAASALPMSTSLRSPSTRRNILRWIASAKTAATRSRRIAATTEEAKVNRRVASNG